MNDFMENGFIIDLSNAKDTLQIINELSNVLEMSESKEKNICLKLRDVELSQAQLLSIKALINATGSVLEFIDTNTERTIESAKELGIRISTINSEPETQEEKAEEPHTDEQMEQVEPQESVEPTVQLPEFMSEDEEGASIETSDVPAFDTLFASGAENAFEQEVEPHSEVPYEIFKTEELEETKNHELPTLYLKQTLRSGQTLSYDGNILVIGDTHPGSELIAKGDITVWGVLGGIAHAGTSGDKNARIRALKLNGIQLRIAGIYAGRANTENIPFIQRSSEFTPQEARIENDTLVVRSIISEI